MNFSIKSLFTKNKVHSEPKEESELLKNIKSLSKYSDLLVFDEVTIYHHTHKYRVPLIIFDKTRGLYIFEKKQWSFDELQNAKIEREEQSKPSQNTLSYNFLQNIIKQKFNELIHNDGVALYNCLLLENLTYEEYSRLDESIKEYLPENSIIFKDMQKADIFKKLQNIAKEDPNLPDTNTVLGNLLIQYTIVDNDTLHFCSLEQREFLDQELQYTFNLTGKHKSGKTNLLLLKAITEVLNNPEKKVIILKPTILSKDILQQKFLNIIEHAIIEIDLNSIEIVTPIELVNKHLHKLKLKQLNDILYIDEKLMKKSFDVADIIMCDDSYLLSDFFIHYLQHIQKDKTLLVVNNEDLPVSYELENNYQNPKKEVQFYLTNPHAKALHLIASACKKYDPKEIMVISNSLSKEKLHDDLTSFIPCPISLIDGDKNLINQNLDNIKLATFNDIVDIQAHYSIIMDLCFNNTHLLEDALNLATDHTDILYEEDCFEIKSLKDKLEDNKN